MIPKLDNTLETLFIPNASSQTNYTIVKSTKKFLPSSVPKVASHNAMPAMGEVIDAVSKYKVKLSTDGVAALYQRMKNMAAKSDYDLTGQL